jgi:hypothetical protein
MASKINPKSAERCLTGLALFERDESGDVMHVWSFPGIDESTKSTLLARSQISDELISKRTRFAFSRSGGIWHYSMATFAITVPKNNKRVQAINFVVSSTKFNPEKYHALLTVMSSVYSEKANVVEIFNLYLSSYTSGTCFCPRPPGQPKGEWTNKDYNDKKALIANCSIREICSTFQSETVILWQAQVLKKNILVYSDSITKLQRFLRTLPHFVFQRGEKVWSTLSPLIMGSETEMDELNKLGYYAAGTTISTLRSDYPKLFDLYIDLDDRTLSVSEHAKKDFGMGKMHKQIAQMLNEQSKAASDTAAIKAITNINLSLIKKIRGISGGLTNQSLQTFSEEQKHSKSEARFMMNFSMSEGLL